MTLDTSTIVVLCSWVAGIAAIVSDKYSKDAAKKGSVRDTPLPTGRDIIDAAWWPVTAVFVMALAIIMHLRGR